MLSCKHYYEVIPPLRSPGQPGDMDCTTQRINYTDPFSNQTLVTRVWACACAVSPAPGVLSLSGGPPTPALQAEAMLSGVVAVAGSPALREVVRPAVSLE